MSSAYSMSVRQHPGSSSTPQEPETGREDCKVKSITKLKRKWRERAALSYSTRYGELWRELAIDPNANTWVCVQSLQNTQKFGRYIYFQAFNQTI